MKLEVGMYIISKDRTDIGVVLKDEKNDIWNVKTKENIQFLGMFWNRKTASHNIIDLIENEDIVEIEYRAPKYKGRITRPFIVNRCIDSFITFENLHCIWYMRFENGKWTWQRSKGFNPKIKSIVTKEQFESMECNIGDE